MSKGRHDFNLGIFDGQVEHALVNEALARSTKAMLLGAQTRLPFFPDDQQLPRLYVGDGRVTFFWKVLKKIPQVLREALLDSAISFTLVQGGSLLYFRDLRTHQAVHIGRRRRTVYLPEALFAQAEQKGYDYWAIAEGVIFASWLLLDYLLLVAVLRGARRLAAPSPTFSLSTSWLRRLVEEHNTHRRDHVAEGRSEIHEFIGAYKAGFLSLGNAELRSGDPFELARRLYEPAIEQRWARDKMERVAEVFSFPQVFLFDRDIIHQAAREQAQALGQPLAPQSFAEVLHDYQDELRFDNRPLLTTLGKWVMPKPRAVFLQEVVHLGGLGLRGLLEAYGRGESEVVPLIHLLWMYLCSLSSDPAGVFTRMGRCRALALSGQQEGLDQALAGVLVRLDRSPEYEALLDQVRGMGQAARAELEDLVQRQRLAEEDEWAPFKVRKQGIVLRADALLGELQGEVGEGGPRPDLQADPVVLQLLENRRLHQHSSDPSGALLCQRSYRRSLAEFGPADPDTQFYLVGLLVRLDRSEHYDHLCRQLIALGAPAVSALYRVFDQISERDQQRQPIREQARLILARLVLQRGFAARRPV
ncbi:MAG: hypothetical protein FJY95_00905 [Candidatus Handelsmanbacteria bacterium]|nr:hypothetical protein [Candidatus Handelsmanbacteria bacterium]